MFWELQEANAANVEPFKRDYADTTKRLTEVIRDYGLGLNVMAAHRAARRLGLSLRREIPHRRREIEIEIPPYHRAGRPRRAGRTTLDSIQAERARLMGLVKELDRQEANLRVAVKLIAGDRVSISGLDEHPLTVHIDPVRAFVQGGGLGKLRDLVGKEKGTPCCD